LVDAFSSPTFLRLLQGHQLDADRFVTHHFTFDQFDPAYEAFANAAETGALKVFISRT
jgi:alcohol dehydrogenase